MNNHDHQPFIGSIAALLGAALSLADIEIWLKLASMTVGLFAGVLGCLSAIKSLRK